MKRRLLCIAASVLLASSSPAPAGLVKIVESDDPARTCATASSDPAPAPRPPGRTERAIALAQAKLSLGLLGALAGDTGRTVSPTGVAAVLAALELGGDGAMKKAIAEVLGADTRPKPRLEAFRTALRRLAAGRGDGPFSGADALFVDKRITLKPGIAETLLAEAQVLVRTVPLDSDDGLTAVNEFVAASTRGRIPTILEPSSKGAALVAVDAFHFRDCWHVAFDPSRTTDGAFRTVDGSSRDVSMMHLDAQPLAHRLAGRFAAVELAYRDPRFVMTLVTTVDAPAPPDAFRPAAKLLAGQGFASASVDLALPAFAAEEARDLLPVLSGLGLASGIASPRSLAGFAEGLTLSAVRQKTVLAVDEAGTVAAAATAAEATRSVSGPQPVRIDFDKPFIFALRHRPTGLIVMSGYVADPRRHGR